MSEIKRIVQGEFYIPIKNNLVINDFEINPSFLEEVSSKHTAFISISKSIWDLRMGKKTSWVDGNRSILSHWEKCALIITETPIVELKNKVPQLIVKDSYEAVFQLARVAREKMNRPVIAITGSVGKSSTRLMIEQMIGETHDLLATRGNNNTQMGVVLHGAKLARQPDVGVLEISLNALNNRGNQSLLIRPDVAMITSIGEAHLSTLHTKENIARFKSRIIDGLTDDGLVVLNQDIDPPILQLLMNKAKQKTKRIVTYSMNNPSATLYVARKEIYKDHTKIEFWYNQKIYQFSLEISSDGMIANALGAILCLVELGFSMAHILPRLHEFRSLPRVMEQKEIHTKDLRHVSILDDSHNASVPAMINAIQTFKEKKKYYQGKKILVLGQIADLGERSQSLHDSLIDSILEAQPDLIFGHGLYMRNVIKQMPAEIVGGWFMNADDLAKRIPYYCSHDSFIMLKGSVSGSDFREVSHLLPKYLKRSNHSLNDFSPHNLANHLHPHWGAEIYHLQHQQSVLRNGISNASNLEGLGHILLLLLVLKKGVDLNRAVVLKKWPTNQARINTKRVFETGETFTIRELIAELISTQHPSATYQLADSVFNGVNQALTEIQNYARELQLNEQAVLNLTGRYRVKEQQSYTLEDLIKIGVELDQIHPINREELYIPQISKSSIFLAFGHVKRTLIQIENRMLFVQIGEEIEEQRV